MKAKLALLISLLFILNQLALAATEETSVDFTVSPGVIRAGGIQIGMEWLTPNDFLKTNLSLIDLHRVNALYPDNNQVIASKLALIIKKPLDSFSFEKMNNAAYISSMLNSVAISKKNIESWRVTNKVRAYGIPFKVSFDLKLKEISSTALGVQLVNYLKDESAGVKGTGRERFMVLDMTNFSQLMYRNYSVVYAKEIGPNETMIVSGIVAAFDLHKANSLFNYPPFSTTKSTMMNNLHGQVLHMAESIQK